MNPYINIHTHKSNSDKDNIHIRSLFPNQRSEILESGFYSIGIHPWYLEEIESQFFNLEKALLEEPKIIAIGEVGLDRSKGDNLELQKEVFKRQILLSEKYQKPLIIHSVKTHSEILQIKKEMNPKMPWIFHGFSGNKEVGLQLISAGIFLSIGEAVFRKEKLREALPYFSFNRLFIETDESELSVEIIYAEIASLKCISVDEVCKRVQIQFSEVFQLELF